MYINAPLVPTESREDVKYSDAGVIGDCELLYGCWELSLSFARAASVLTAKPSLQL